MTHLLTTWAVLTLSMFVAAQLLPKMKIKGGILSHFMVSGAFALLMMFTGWFFHLLLGALSFGLLTMFSFVAKILVVGIVLKLTDLFSDRLEVKGFSTAFAAALIMSVTGLISDLVLRALPHG